MAEPKMTVEKAPKQLSLMQRMVNVAKAVGDIEKTGEMKFGQTYKYVEWSAVANRLRVILAENGVVPYVSMESQETVAIKTAKGSDSWRTYVKIRVTFESASDRPTNNLALVLDEDPPPDSFSVSWYGQADDSGDKGIQKAATNAYKYLMMKTFLIPGDDSVDTDAGEAPTNRSNNSVATTPKPIRAVLPPARARVGTTPIVQKGGTFAEGDPCPVCQEGSVQKRNRKPPASGYYAECSDRRYRDQQTCQWVDFEAKFNGPSLVMVSTDELMPPGEFQ